MVDVERWLSYKGTCHVILLAKLHDMYLYKTDNSPHQPILSQSQMWLSYTGFTVCPICVYSICSGLSVPILGVYIVSLYQNLRTIFLLQSIKT